MLQIDAPRIRQVLLNLLLNAIQAAPPGGNVRVAIEMATIDDQTDVPPESQRRRPRHRARGRRRGFSSPSTAPRKQGLAWDLL